MTDRLGRRPTLLIAQSSTAASVALLGFMHGPVAIAAVAFLVWQSRQGFAWLADFPRALHFESLLPAPLQSPLGITALIAAVLAVIAVLSGAVAYSTSEKR